MASCAPCALRGVEEGTRDGGRRRDRWAAREKASSRVRAANRTRAVSRRRALGRRRTAQSSEDHRGASCNARAVCFFHRNRRRSIAFSRAHPVELARAGDLLSVATDEACMKRRLALTLHPAASMATEGLVGATARCRLELGASRARPADPRRTLERAGRGASGARSRRSGRGRAAVRCPPGAAAAELRPAELKGLDERPRRTYRKRVSNGPIAQLVELRTFNP